MTENRYRPSLRRLGAGWQEQIEIDLIYVLCGRCSGECSGFGYKFARMYLIIRRKIFAERNLRDRTGCELIEQRKRGRKRGKLWRVVAGLFIKCDAAHAIKRKHRTRPAQTEIEICRSRRGRFDLVSNLL